MKKLLVPLTAALLLSLTLASTATAQSTPAIYPVQGFLTDADGAPVDGQFDLRFRLYDATETVIHQESIEVTVTQGSFSTYLGSKAALSADLFAQHSQMELGIKVGADNEMTPRISVGSVPYAARAASAEAAEVADTALHADVADTVTDAIPVYRVTNTYCHEAPGTISFSSTCHASQHNVGTCLDGCAGTNIVVRNCSGNCSCVTPSFVLCPIGQNCPTPLLHNAPRCDNTEVGMLVPSN